MESHPKRIYRRSFFVPCFQAPVTAEAILLQDLRKGRVDHLCRCISGSIMKSKGTRRDACIFFGLGGNTERLMSINGDLIRHIRVCEQVIGRQIKTLFEAGCISEEEKLSMIAQGVKKMRTLKGMNLYETSGLLNCFQMVLNLTDASAEDTIILYLHENGETVEGIQLEEFPGHVICVIGDYIGLEDEQASELENYVESKGITWMNISLGQMSLLTSHCLVILNHYLDRINDRNSK